ncbi:hypothetical protein AB0M42_28100 [Streptomyces sp. NPDC051784]|uniref:hypothetical protein n=1 Tax=Streptomyces sp. NPDC051784 TaxID=3155805 RepID=UPI00342DFA1F
MPETTSAPAGATLPAPSRRALPVPLRVLGVWLAVLTLLAGFGTASATAGESGRHPRAAKVSLAGVWDLTVNVHAPDGVSTTTPRFVFRADHQLTAEGPPDENGQPLYSARGFWTEKANGTIAFYINHGGAEGGAIPGDVQAVHMGRISGRTFHTTAYAFVTVAPDQPLVGPVDVDSTATRVSGLPAS